MRRHSPHPSRSKGRGSEPKAHTALLCPLYLRTCDLAISTRPPLKLLSFFFFKEVTHQVSGSLIDIISRQKLGANIRVWNLHIRAVWKVIKLPIIDARKNKGQKCANWHCTGKRLSKGILFLRHNGSTVWRHNDKENCCLLLRGGGEGYGVKKRAERERGERGIERLSDIFFQAQTFTEEWDRGYLVGLI